MTESPRAEESIDGHVLEFGLSTPLSLECNVSLAPWKIAFRTYGTPNADKSNAILICHALTGDQHVAHCHPITGKPGWWEYLVGPDKPIDTNRFWVICSNVIGGCMGSSGPPALNPAINAPWGLEFPMITVHDMVHAQAHLIEHLGISQLLSVIGGSMGGMQVLSWAAKYPDRVFSALPIASALRHSPQNIAFHEVGRQAIIADQEWRAGRYIQENTRPRKGLAVARMAANITYMSESALQQKFGRDLQDRSGLTFSFDADFQVESYLRHQGRSFVERFDAASYLYLTRAMDYFDLAAEYGGKAAGAFLKSKTRFCIISFTSDWLFPTAESKKIVRALHAAGADVSFVEIDSDRGHDSFLVEDMEFFKTLSGFLHAVARTKGC